MRVAMIGWEYPPFKAGGLATLKQVVLLLIAMDLLAVLQIREFE